MSSVLPLSPMRSPLDTSSKPRQMIILSIILAALLSRSTVVATPHAAVKEWYSERTRIRNERKRREAETPLNTPALEKKLVDLYIRDPSSDSRTLLVPHMGKISKVRITPTSPELYKQHLPLFPRMTGSEKLGVNKEFWRMLKAVLKVTFPSKRGKEVFLLLLHSFFLVSRTILSVMVARLDGKIVRDLVSANAAGFLRGLGWWFILAVPSTYTNAMSEPCCNVNILTPLEIRYLERKLALAFRTNLTRYIHDLYLNYNLNYYKFGSGRVGHTAVEERGEKKHAEFGHSSEAAAGTADQFITTDVARFCDSLAALYGNLGKPALDLLIFTSQLSSSLGPLGTIGLFANYGLTAYILRKATPAFGRMAATTARLEGNYRAGLSRVGRDAEEIAFYNGGKRERGILDGMYRKLKEHVQAVNKARIPYGMIEDFVIKYLWSAAGYGLMSIPIFFPVTKTALGSMNQRVNHEVAERTEGYMSNRRLLLSLADAGGRLMYSGKDLAELSGYTSRVYSLISTLHSLDNGIYPEHPRPSSLSPNDAFYDMANIQGQVSVGPNHVLLRGVPIVAPPEGSGAERGGEELLKSLDLRVEKGDHTLITGPNGVGKTSVARIIAQLWPVWKGLLERPRHGEGGIFFLPQRPYLSIGSLRDQVIYPHTYAEMKSRGRTDTELMTILEAVHLEYLPGREGGWETRKEWKDVLSGGEKQRMGMARLFYHRPQFAVLDECTSAVSSDVEGLMYEHAKALGITLVTISHRPSLLKYHNRHLRLGDPSLSRVPSSLSRAQSMYSLAAFQAPVQSDAPHHKLPTTPLASQGWQLTTLSSSSAEEKLELDKEIEALEMTLNEEVEKWEKRLQEINKELKCGESYVEESEQA
ncbi:ATP-binding cassette (ABC) transporter, putative [Cryptococcus gattii WM276]|uniref:ATP-binding cassette (ABC) transporter, putative n=2 Tax=Cryptococcus gattii TaxID=37769 RepID=E6QYA4_CRYGW|nr:ATP-binding cassette (ABC) transporter, putative [Cryptococcus gattii WM276]ADV19885.1 ATP-binding cassette (ABC) transporter, putative [Cryptococcus gattii WM276]KIR79501.1 ATP-binding cassette, subfamily D (ALD), peroxisomal long-chain fatty acid import protein [Cryptococcus gattii EJB2]KJE03120.1 ATP-binding cassette, subfamily D (ALD), peroxisomal long-chain fatty acid import protein [Cryptococcus gattii NT-10]